MALSYTIYEKGGYLGWSLSRFWGVSNWSSTLNQRLEEDPVDAMEIEDIIGPFNKWEIKNSNLNYTEGHDYTEVRLVSSSLCRDNGWRGKDGAEQWDRVKLWSSTLIKNNTGYRFVRSGELSDAIALCKEKTPLILDSVACVSDSQFNAIKTYLSEGGIAWLNLPFGTHDEMGFERKIALSEILLKSRYRNLIVEDNAKASDFLEMVIQKGIFEPVLKQTSGDTRWTARIRIYNNLTVMHFMNTALIPIPHQSVKDAGGVSVLKDIDSKIEDNNLTYQINTKKINLNELSVLSPELGEEQRKVSILHARRGYSTINVNLEGVKIYAVAQ